jgi:hypothetical protein
MKKKDTPKPPAPEQSEGIEPHEIAQQMTPDQMGEFLENLMRRARLREQSEGSEK